jgi:hypothetical protein
MSTMYYSTYWFLNNDQHHPEKLPPDWAEQKAKEWVAEEPECREIVRSCGWATEVKEAFKNRPPRWRDFDRVAVVHLGVDTDSATRVSLGLTVSGETLMAVTADNDDVLYK